MNKPYIVDNSYEGIRIDKWIRNNLGNVPQGLIEKSLRAGKIKLNLCNKNYIYSKWGAYIYHIVQAAHIHTNNTGIIFYS